MDSTRRDFLILGGKMFVMTGIAAAAFEHVLAGTPEKADTYKTADHWWAMLIDVEKCVGSGHCVRACKLENDVVDEAYFFRTWVERYHVDPLDMNHPIVDSPNGGMDGFPETYPDGQGEDLLRAEDVQSLRGFAVHAGLPGRRDVPDQGRRRPDRQGLLPRVPLLRAGLSVRLPLHRSPDEYGGQVHALLPPHHEGAAAGVLRGLPDRRAPARGSEEPADPIMSSCGRTPFRC
jgi:hypothetical protein